MPTLMYSTAAGRCLLHLACIPIDGNVERHLAGVWREVGHTVCYLTGSAFLFWVAWCVTP